MLFHAPIALQKHELFEPGCHCPCAHRAKQEKLDQPVRTQDRCQCEQTLYFTHHDESGKGLTGAVRCASQRCLWMHVMAHAFFSPVFTYSLSDYVRHH